MAISLDSKSDYNEGIVRVVVKREGNIVKGDHLDRSELRIVKQEGGNFIIMEKVSLMGEEKLIRSLQTPDTDFLGFEDPDIVIDEMTNLIHVYFTIPFIGKKYGQSRIHLGHASGKNIYSLTITQPVILGLKNDTAKELSVAPRSLSGLRYNLYESSDVVDGIYYSVIKKYLVLTLIKDGMIARLFFTLSFKKLNG
jgi:hypothetical protein